MTPASQTSSGLELLELILTKRNKNILRQMEEDSVHEWHHEMADLLSSYPPLYSKKLLLTLEKFQF